MSSSITLTGLPGLQDGLGGSQGLGVPGKLTPLLFPI